MTILPILCYDFGLKSDILADLNGKGIGSKIQSRCKFQDLDFRGLRDGPDPSGRISDFLDPRGMDLLDFSGQRSRIF